MNVLYALSVFYAFPFTWYAKVISSVDVFFFSFRYTQNGDRRGLSVKKRPTLHAHYHIEHSGQLILESRRVLSTDRDNRLACC